MSKRSNIRDKKVKKLPGGKFLYQIILDFVPNARTNNNETYNTIFGLLKESAVGDWHIPRVKPRGFHKYTEARKKKYFRLPRSIREILLEDPTDLLLLKLCHPHDIKAIYHLVIS